MTVWLKQSTAVTIHIGPFVDETDGKTAETGLTISQADVRLSKNGADIAQKNDATSCTHDEIGYYTCPLNTTDTNTLGHLKLMVHESGALPVWMEFMVVTANIWDSLFGADKLDANVAEMAAGVITATVIATGAIDADAIADNAIDAGAIADNAITAAKIAADAIGASELAADAVAEIADAVWDEVMSGHSGGGTSGNFMTAMASRLPANFMMGSSVPDPMDDEINAIKAKTDLLTLAGVADAVWDELRAGHQTDASFGKDIALGIPQDRATRTK